MKLSNKEIPISIKGCVILYFTFKSVIFLQAKVLEALNDLFLNYLVRSELNFKRYTVK